MPVIAAYGLYVIFIGNDVKIGYLIFMMGGTMCVFTAFAISDLGWFAWKESDNESK